MQPYPFLQFRIFPTSNWRFSCSLYALAILYNRSKCATRDRPAGSSHVSHSRAHRASRHRPGGPLPISSKGSTKVGLRAIRVHASHRSRLRFSNLSGEVNTQLLRLHTGVYLDLQLGHVFVAMTSAFRVSIVALLWNVSLLSGCWGSQYCIGTFVIFLLCTLFHCREN